MANSNKFSLKYKLMFLLILVSTLSLFLYAVLMVNIFVKDKTKYVYDSAEIVARTIAGQVRGELQMVQRINQPIEDAIDAKSFKFSELSNDYFLRQKRIEHMFVYLPTTGESFQEMDHLYLERRVIKKYAPGGEVIEGLLKQAMATGYAVQAVDSTKRFFVVARKGSSRVHKRDYLTISVFSSPALYETFATPSAFKNYLLSRNSFLSMEPKYDRNKTEALKISSIDFFKPILTTQFPSGVAELENYAKEFMLVSYAQVGFSDLIVASVVPKKKALKVVSEVFRKSLFFVAIMASVALILGFTGSSGVVNLLAMMRVQVAAMTEGDFSKVVKANTKDEVHALSDEINDLSKKLKS